jgi:hypothetical protein
VRIDHRAARSSESATDPVVHPQAPSTVVDSSHPSMIGGFDRYLVRATTVPDAACSCPPQR